MSTTKQRVITAIWLAVVFLATLLLLPVIYLAMLSVVVLLAAAWEWAALGGQSSFITRGLYSASQLVFFLPFAVAVLGDGQLLDNISAHAALEFVLAVASVVWLLALVTVLRYPQAPATWLSEKRILIGGTLLLLAAVSSLLYFRIQPSGIIWILYSVVIVVAADTGAYFCGRRWGKHKLAFNVSPGKSWEGAVGGLVAAQLVAVVFYFAWGQALLSGTNNTLIIFLVVALLQSTVSVIGDLFESLLKRRVGIKDSGTLLPGHGGVLDRIDGLLASLPLLAICYIKLGW